VAEQAAWHQVRYWDAYETWGCNNCIPTLDEMIELAHEKGWDRLRGNCVSQSIVLCSLLRALGFQAKIRTTSTHAWVKCEVDGKSLDLLYPVMGQTVDDLALPREQLHGTALLAARQLGADLNGHFGAVDLLPETGGPIPYFKYPSVLICLVPVLIFWIYLFRVWDRVTAKQNLAGRRLPAAVSAIGLSPTTERT
jgi:hypothetical protein